MTTYPGLYKYQAEVLRLLLTTGRVTCLGENEAWFGKVLARDLKDLIRIENKHHDGAITIALRGPALARLAARAKLPRQSARASCQAPE